MLFFLYLNVFLSGKKIKLRKSIEQLAEYDLKIQDHLNTLRCSKDNCICQSDCFQLDMIEIEFLFVTLSARPSLYRHVKFYKNLKYLKALSQNKKTKKKKNKLEKLMKFYYKILKTVLDFSASNQFKHIHYNIVIDQTIIDKKNELINEISKLYEDKENIKSWIERYMFMFLKDITSLNHVLNLLQNYNGADELVNISQYLQIMHDTNIDDHLNKMCWHLSELSRTFDLYRNVLNDIMRSIFINKKKIKKKNLYNSRHESLINISFLS